MAVVSQDLRMNRSVYPIALEVVDLVLNFSVNATIITKDIHINGSIMDIYFEVPSLDGTQCRLYLLDADAKVLYDSELVDESTGDTPHHLVPGLSLGGCGIEKKNATTVKVVTVDNQLADRTFKVKIYLA